MKRWIPALAAMTAIGCGGDDGSDVDVRDATAAECPAGGVALVKDGQAFPVCDAEAQGEQGPAGPQGETGPAGATGPQGPAGPAGASDVIESTLLCQSNDGTTFFSIYVWVMSDGDAVGICTINENGTQWSQSTALIGTQCTVESILGNGLVTMNLGTNPPSLSGAFTGTMACL